MSPLDIVILTLALGGTAGGIAATVIRKKRGKGGCGSCGACAGCPGGCRGCHRAPPQDEQSTSNK